MKPRFHTLDEAARALDTSVYALLQAAEAGELTLALPTHGKYLFRFCPRERGKVYPDASFQSCDCIPVPPHTISVLLANRLTTDPEPATFSRFELPGETGAWFEVWHIDDFHNRDIPTSTPGLIIRLSESSLRITDAELERVASDRERDEPFDFVGPDSRRLALSGIRQGIERLTYMVATEQAAEPAPITPAPAGASEQDAEPATDDGMTPVERRKNHDMDTERGCRRLILDHWDTIEKLHGPSATGLQVHRQLKNGVTWPVDGPELPVLKTVRNRLLELRKEGLIPG